MDEQHRNKISAALKGRMPKNLAAINANKRGPGNPMWGKPSSRKGKIIGPNEKSRETWANPDLRRKMSERFRGERSPNWKGGVTKQHKAVRHGLDFKLWREAVFARDNHTCRKCLVRGGTLHPHHKDSFSDYPDLRFVVENGVTLCKDCHRWFHTVYGTSGTMSWMISEFLLSNDITDRPPPASKKQRVKRLPAPRVVKLSRSETMRARWKNQDFREKMLKLLASIHERNRGRKLSEETRLKISLVAKLVGTGKWSKGKHQSEEFKRKRSIAMSGSNNHRWKGTQCRSQHTWLVRSFGRPDHCESSICSYPKINRRGKVVESPTGFKWSNPTGVKDRDRTNWIMLCNHCWAELYRGKGRSGIGL